MSYEHLWGVSFADLRVAGFRPLCDQAWAGVRNLSEMGHAVARAEKMGMTRQLRFSRQDLGTRHRYTYNLAHLSGMSLGFVWSLLPIQSFDIPTNLLEPTDLSAFGFFRSEKDAIAWKLAVI